MSVSPPAQYATSRPAWKRVNMHRKKKQGCRPPSNRFHARPISETSNSTVRTDAPLVVSQPMRKQRVAAATAVRQLSTSIAAPNLGDSSEDSAALARYIVGEEFICIRSDIR